MPSHFVVCVRACTMIKVYDFVGDCHISTHTFENELDGFERNTKSN